ncbi:MAG: PqqD family protein [Anaerolineales bacterium]|nr:PqqD family protein [Anaerolineales bacterium]
MTETTRQPQIANDLIWRLLDNNAVVVSPHVGEVRVLNGIGTVIWQLLVEKKSPAQIEDFLVANYDVSHADAQKDIQDFIKDLADRGILIWDS